MTKFPLKIIALFILATIATAASNDSAATTAATITNESLVDQQDQKTTLNLRSRDLKKGPKPPKKENTAPSPNGKAIGFYCCRPFRKEADSAECGVEALYTDACLEALSAEGVEFCGCEWTGNDCEEIEVC